MTRWYFVPSASVTDAGIVTEYSASEVVTAAAVSAQVAFASASVHDGRPDESVSILKFRSAAGVHVFFATIENEFDPTPLHWNSKAMRLLFAVVEISVDDVKFAAVLFRNASAFPAVIASPAKNARLRFSDDDAIVQERSALRSYDVPLMVSDLDVGTYEESDDTDAYSVSKYVFMNAFAPVQEIFLRIPPDSAVAMRSVSFGVADHDPLMRTPMLASVSPESLISTYTEPLQRYWYPVSTVT